MNSQETIINEKDKIPTTNNVLIFSFFLILLSKLKALQDLNKKIDECLLSNQNKFCSQNNCKSLINEGALLEANLINKTNDREIDVKNITKESNNANIHDTIIELDRQITERLQKLGKIDEISSLPQNKKNILESIVEENSDCEKSLSEIKIEIDQSISFKNIEESEEILKETKQNYDDNHEDISKENLLIESVLKDKRNSLDLNPCKTLYNSFERKKSASFYSNDVSSVTETNLKNKYFKEKFMEVNMKLKKFNRSSITQKELYIQKIFN